LQAHIKHAKEFIYFRDFSSLVISGNLALFYSNCAELISAYLPQILALLDK